MQVCTAGLADAGAIVGARDAASEQALVAAGFSESIVWVLDGNARAERFYAAVGYELDGEHKRRSLAEGVDIGEFGCANHCYDPERPWRVR